MSKKKDFYNRDAMSENVDTLMYDMTVGTRNRRKRDADMLSKIRERQSEENLEGKSSLIKDRAEKDNFLSKLKKLMKRKDKSKQEITPHAYVMHEETDEMNKTECTPNIGPIKYEDYDGDEDTVIIGEDEFDDYDTDTVVIDDNTPIAVIEFQLGEELHRGYIRSGITSIGYSADKNDIVVKNKRISRKHAELIAADEKIYVRDMGSTNGTYINGSKHRLPKGVGYRLSFGDILTLADVNFKVMEYREEKNR